LIGRLGANDRLIGWLMPHSLRTGRWRGSADGNARLIIRLGTGRRLIGRFGANGGLIGRLMPHSPRTGRWRGSADGNARRGSLAGTAQAAG
jgi:hypothetical protein